MGHTKIGWTLMTAAAVLAAPPAVAPPASASPTIPAMPDLSSYATVAALATAGATFFRTTDGLHCKMTTEKVDCAGVLPATGVAANAIGIGSDVSSAGAGYGGSIPGVRLTATPAESHADDGPGDAAPVLRAGDKVVGPGSECAVTARERTICTVGQPARQWLVVSPSETGIGPATAGLPAGYPDPLTFVQGYARAANVRFDSTFSIDGARGELTCRMSFSSVTPPLGCDGDIPGTDANEVVIDHAGTARVTRTDTPQFTTTNGIPVPHLPVGYQSPYPGTCLAITGGVACLRGAHGFKVDASGASTF